jgi:hypothetical protein
MILFVIGAGIALSELVLVVDPNTDDGLLLIMGMVNWLEAGDSVLIGDVSGDVE